MIGKVLFSVPYAGYVVAAAQKPYGFLLIIIIPAVLLIGDEARKIFSELKKLKAQKSEVK